MVLETAVDATHADSLLAEIGWIRRLALQLVRDAAEADDVVQQTLLAALEQRGGPPRELKPWLAAVARRQAAFARRTSARRAQREAVAARSEALPSAEELASRAEVQRALVDAVLALDEPYRSAVLLRYFEGLEPAEIARRRRIPPGTVRSHLSRGLAELRTALDRRHGGDTRTWCTALLPLALEPSGAPFDPLAATSATLGGLAVKHAALLVAGTAALAAALAYAALRGDPAVPLPSTAAAARSAELVDPAATAPVALAPPQGDLRSAPPASAAPEAGGAAEVAPAPAPLRGRVFDASTGTPLENYLVELSAPENTDAPATDSRSSLMSVLEREPGGELLVTDAEGRFESALEREPGPVRVLLRDAPGALAAGFAGQLSITSPPPEQRIDWDGASEIALTASSGPTYRVRFAPPPGMTHGEFDAVLFEGDAARHDVRIGRLLDARAAARPGSVRRAFPRRQVPARGSDLLDAARGEPRRPLGGRRGRPPLRERLRGRAVDRRPAGGLSRGRRGRRAGARALRAVARSARARHGPVREPRELGPRARREPRGLRRPAGWSLPALGPRRGHAGPGARPGARPGPGPCASASSSRRSPRRPTCAASCAAAPAGSRAP